jgi:D-tyrosyl-tRNA(Tyr) deacylase
MKLVVQRVLRAAVRIQGVRVAAIERGLLVLCGVAHGDTLEDALYLARKTRHLRVFDDADGKMNLAPSEVGGAFLVVSQFTLYGDCLKGNRPSYMESAPPDEGERGYEAFVAALRDGGGSVQTGRFRAMMEVELVNDGPVTLILESRGRACA